MIPEVALPAKTLTRDARVPAGTSGKSASAIKKLFNENKLLWLLLGLGIFLRLFHFIDDRSFWRDEVYLNLSLVKYSYWELATGPLQYEQKAPIGYLWFVKTLVLLFGKKEMALRLFSLICGIGALIVFVPVARHFLKPATAVLALGILAFSSPLIYHAVEAKQYSAELLAAVLALLLYTRYEDKKDLPSLLKWGVWGGLLLWFSFSVVFLLAGIAFAFGWQALFKKDWKQLFRYLIPFSWWGFNFLLTYVFFIGKYHDSGWLVDFFDNVLQAFMPLPPAAVSDLVWFGRTTYLILSSPLGLLLNFGNHVDYSNLEVLLRLPVLPLIMLLSGTVGLLLKEKFRFQLLLFPVLLTLLASGLKQYPFFERLLVFLAPVFTILICYGVERCAALVSPNAKAMLILCALLLMPPCFNALREMIYRDKLGGSIKIEFLRDAFLYVNERVEAGDLVYVYWNATHGYQYYKEAYGLKYKALVGRDVRHISANEGAYRQNLLADFAHFAGKKRVWVIFDRNLRVDIGDFYGKPAWYYQNDFIPGKIVETHLSASASKTDVFEKNGIVAVLYEQ